jgi:hypothetical protein
MDFIKFAGRFVLLSLLFFSSCSIVNQGKEFKNLFHCKYALKDVKILSVGGVDVSKMGKGDELPSDVYFTLLKKMFSQDINSEFKFDIEVYNPMEKPAGSQGMEWKMFIKDEMFSEGTVDSAIFVEPKGKGHFWVKADINLFKLLNNISLPQLMNVLNDNDWQKVWEESELEIKLKPWYKSGSKVKKYPGYISFKP